MTAQMPDRLVLRDRVYAIARIDGEGLFDPLDAGLRPFSTCTACWRGYVCRYAVRDDQLILDSLWVSLGRFQDGELQPSRGPAIDGVEPLTPSAGPAIFNNVYEGLGLSIPFTGEMLVGDDFIRELYVHMGFHPAWKYRTVLALKLEQGRLLAARDVSKKMATVRRAKERSPSAEGEG